MKKVLAAAFVSLMLVSGAAFATPTATQVETAIQQQNWQKADSELQEVLQAHPDNARAHYLYAQVLSQEGRHAAALTQIQQAKTLDPQVRFTDPSRFAQTEARIRSDAARAGAVTNSNTTHNPFAQQSSSGDSQQAAFAQQAPEHHGPSIGMWVGILIVIGAIALVLRWTLRRARSQSDTNADEERRTQLKRATDLLNDVRSLKLDVRLSTVPGHEQLEKEVEAMETQLRELVQGLSDRKNPVPPYQLDDLERQLASLKARAEGRPDPNAAPSYASNPNESPYAREADAQFGRQVPPGQAPYPYPPQYPPQQQPPVIIQQPGGGFGGGMGGLLTGVLLGEALNSGRDRVIERDVIVDDERRRGGDGGGGDNSSIDFGQGSNDWSDDGSSGGNIDMGSDDSNNWNDT
ncbi:MAG TPA: tetratricopeptide repeat protein [Paraburkholderia sp.]|nr:tetratricopeptide repeat protein [Paraburkholderia sp.]